jgi:superfamily I DNA and/or RNA helicase
MKTTSRKTPPSGVNLLKSVLPAGARVGTVDKFQGQEAAIVLMSMTTSIAEDVSRELEFLYSRNRLNVAISRAVFGNCSGESAVVGGALQYD